jgi:hypothetical protein
MDKKEQGAQYCGHGWTASGPSILTPANLKIVEETLREGWVCGFHMYYCGGRGGDPVAFRSYETYLKHLEHARPGDLFILWSVPEIRRRQLLLVDARNESEERAASPLLSEPSLRCVREYLAGVSKGVANEVLAVASCRDGVLEAVITDLDGSGWDRFLELSRDASISGGVLCVLPFTTIDQPEFYLLEAKLPNEKGEVPLGGAIGCEIHQ